MLVLTFTVENTISSTSYNISMKKFLRILTSSVIMKKKISYWFFLPLFHHHMLSSLNLCRRQLLFTIDHWRVSMRSNNTIWHRCFKRVFNNFIWGIIPSYQMWGAYRIHWCRLNTLQLRIWTLVSFIHSHEQWIYLQLLSTL